MFNRKINFKKGAGTSVLGLGLIYILAIIAFMFMHLTLSYANSTETQIAADSIADGVAVYAATNNVSISEAQKEAKEIAELIEKESNMDITTVKLNVNDYDDNLVDVTIKTNNKNLSNLSDAKTYTIERTATTEFSNNNANAFVDWMVNVAEDDTHGYCQYAGVSIDGVTSVGRYFQPDVDCSSFVYYALLNNGYTKEQLGRTVMTTSFMNDVLLRNGFTRYNYASVKNNLQPGDILWRIGHTEVYIGDGKRVGAHSSETGGRNGKPGDQTGKEVSVATMRASELWTYVYRAP